MTLPSGSPGVYPAPSQDLPAVTDGLYLYSAPLTDGDLGRGVPGQRVWVYLVANSASPFPETISLQTAWQDSSANFVIAVTPPENKAQADIFVSAARETFDSLAPGQQPVFGWVDNPNQVASPDQSISFDMWFNTTKIPGQKQIGSIPKSIPLVAARIGLRFSISNAQIISLPAADPAPGTPAAFDITADQATQGIQLEYDGQVQSVLTPPTGWSITLPMSGPEAGSVLFPIAADPGQLFSKFGGLNQLQYGAEAENRLQAPLFPSKVPSGVDKGFVAFIFVLNPLQAFDYRGTRVQIDRAGVFDGGSSAPTSDQVKNARALQSPYFFANDGGPLNLTPFDPAEDGSPALPPGPSPESPASLDQPIAGGFAFSSGLSGSPAEPHSYLSPAGLFSVSPGSSPVTSPDTTKMMPGLFSREFLSLDAGDLLLFVSNEPGNLTKPLPSSPPVSPGSSPYGGDAGHDTLLDSATTMSWAAVWPGVTSSGRGFFSQPSSASFFGPPGSGEKSLSGAGAQIGLTESVNVKISPLTNGALFPMMPYGGIALTNEATGHLYNPDLAAATIESIESEAMAPLRHERLVDAPAGPIAIPAGQVEPDSRLSAITTPEGFVIETLEDGTWSSLTLALGNERETKLAFGASPSLLAPDLGNLLTQDQLFLVITAIPSSWNFNNEIKVGGFEFKLSTDSTESGHIGSPVAGEPSILVFKFNNRVSLKDLSADPSAWAEPEKYAPSTETVRQRLLDAFEFAETFKQDGSDPFADFNQIAKDPMWTGFISFAAPLNGNGMPADFQMLLGGVPGVLRAHHLGVQMNKLEADEKGGFNIAQSSVFGVVAFERPSGSPSPTTTSLPARITSSTLPDPEYDVDLLIAVISNSALISLAAEVSLVPHTFFGRSVALVPEPVTPSVPRDSITIRGQYQRHGNTGRVIFTTKSPFVFDLPAADGASRVIETVRIEGASLVPVSGGPSGSPSSSPSGSPDGTQIVADFQLSGQILFGQGPFPGVDLDLFSYGLNDLGLGFDGLTARVSFRLDAEGTVAPNSKSVTMVLDGFTATQNTKSIRPDSLLSTLPLKLSRFQVATNGGTVGSRAKPVNVIQLAPQGSLPIESPAASPATTATPAPYVTTSPTFALEYEMSLGTLGSLSGAHSSISASLLLAWGPSPTVPSNDAAAVMVQLPSLSAGFGGFDLEGLLKTKFEEANLLKVDLENGSTVYGMLFGNVQLSVFGFTIPPGVLVDFFLFAGTDNSSPGAGQSSGSNIAWLLAAKSDKGSP